MDMKLSEIFESVAIIEPNSFKLWDALTGSFPAGHFIDVIEEKFGCLFDDMAKKDVEEKVI